MITLLLIVHIFVCLVLVMVVLLQTGKGAELGASFGGGGSNTLFGSRGAGTFLSKLTAASAVVFMLTSLFLALHWSGAASSSIVREPAGQQAPAPQPHQGGLPSIPGAPAPARPVFPAPGGGK